MQGYLGKLRATRKPPTTTSEEMEKTVTVVSGLPRSGTSMMMKMLEAGGMPPLTDEIRTADADNPKGYYEFERVKQLDKGDTAWLKEAQGKAVKVIAALLKHLPPEYTYRVIFMRRDLEETLRSQRRMLIRRGKDSEEVTDEEMEVLFRKHLDHITDWLDEQPHCEVVYISYNEVLKNPVGQAQKINQFIGGGLDMEKMASVVDPDLYRQRR
jgi:hypothetical protein